MKKPKKVQYKHHRGCECNKCWAASAKNDTCEEYEKWLLELIEEIKNGINEGWGCGSDAWNALAILDGLIKEIKK